MRIAGMEKTSFVDWPGRIVSTIFTPGCNLDCFYCHNRHLLAPGEDDHVVPTEAVIEFLRSRRGFLDGLCVTGGEPTLQPGLEEFLRSVRALGYDIKLDTNGTRPWIVRQLIDEELVDFVAMDVKAPLDKYEPIVGGSYDVEAIGETIDLLLEGRVDCEFRTTYAPQLDRQDIHAIAERIAGAPRYAIQQYRRPGLGVNLFGLTNAPEPHPDHVLYESADIARAFVRHVEVRGADVVPAVETATERTRVPADAPVA